MRRAAVAVALLVALGGGSAVTGCGAKDYVAGIPGAIGGLFGEQSPESALFELTKTRNTLQESINEATAAGLLTHVQGRALTDRLLQVNQYLIGARVLLELGRDDEAQAGIDKARDELDAVASDRNKIIAGGE